MNPSELFKDKYLNSKEAEALTEIKYSARGARSKITHKDKKEEPWSEFEIENRGLLISSVLFRPFSDKGNFVSFKI
jgi:hypothetical protein